MSQSKRSDNKSDSLADVEAQVPRFPVAKTQGDSEYTVSTTTKIGHLGVYFLCNIALTIYNKLVLGKFSYPWLLTSIHAGSASLGCYLLMVNGHFTLTKLAPQQELTLAAFSVLFTINIAVSNVSLGLVSIPFHQIMRSTCPVFAVLIYRLRYKRAYAMTTYLSLIPVVLGVGLATYGDYYFTMYGFALTLLGVVLAAVKTVATNRIMTGPLALSPLETLFRMSPLAFVQALVCACVGGEVSSFLEQRAVPGGVETRTLILILAGNGLLAFMLNVSSFSTNKIAGALTMTVCGNVKQCLTVLLGIVLFEVKVGALNGLGMGIALGGAAWYSAVELHSKNRAAR